MDRPGSCAPSTPEWQKLHSHAPVRLGSHSAPEVPFESARRPPVFPFLLDPRPDSAVETYAPWRESRASVFPHLRSRPLPKSHRGNLGPWRSSGCRAGCLLRRAPLGRGFRDATISRKSCQRPYAPIGRRGRSPRRPARLAPSQGHGTTDPSIHIAGNASVPAPRGGSGGRPDDPYPGDRSTRSSRPDKSRRHHIRDIVRRPSTLSGSVAEWFVLRDRGGRSWPRRAER